MELSKHRLEDELAGVSIRDQRWENSLFTMQNSPTNVQ